MHTSTKWLIGEIAITVFVLTLLGITNYEPLFPYAVHKLLHIFGAVIFLGNIIVTGTRSSNTAICFEGSELGRCVVHRSRGITVAGEWTDSRHNVGRTTWCELDYCCPGAVHLVRCCVVWVFNSIPK